MLVALLSSIEPSRGHPEGQRAFLDVAGQSVIMRQARLALALGCERVVCIAQGLPPGLIAVQHMVEREGMRFHAIAGPRALAGLVSVADEILVCGDGVVPDSEILREHLGERPGLLALPAEPAVERGFERIDRDRAWAGVLRTSAGDVERLGDLPPDIDALSALMRVAVQRGRRIVDLPEAVLTGGRVAMVDGPEAAHQVAVRAVSDALPVASWAGPFAALADKAMRAGAPELLGRPAAVNALRFGVALLAAIALAAAWQGVAAAALAVLAAAAMVLRASEGLGRVADAGKGWWSRHGRMASLVVLDLLLVTIVLAITPRSAWPRALFHLVIVLGLLRLCTLFGPRWLGDLAQDRTLLLAVLATGAAFGVLAATFQAVAVLVLAALIIVHRRRGITGA